MSPSEIAALWDSEILAVEFQMAANWLERSFVPIADSVPNLEVQKIRVLNKIAKFVSARYPETSVGGRSQTFNEVWVETVDHLVGGYIDCVIEGNRGTTLCDFKSGRINTYIGDSIKPEYVVQLQLYAALFAESRGTWPARLAIIPVVGKSVFVEIDREHCLGLVKLAKDYHRQVNSLVAEIGSNTEQYRKLARVSEDACRRCGYRPICQAYRGSSISAERNETWQADCIGEVLETMLFQNCSMSVTVQTKNGAVRVRGLSTAQGRHPALPFLKTGNAVGLYNLRTISGSNDLTQGRSTVIYLE
jgi:hypothetical protein